MEKTTQKSKNLTVKLAIGNLLKIPVPNQSLIIQNPICGTGIYLHHDYEHYSRFKYNSKKI